MDERRDPARETATAAAVPMHLSVAGGLDGGLAAPRHPFEALSAPARSGAALVADPPLHGLRHAARAEERTERRLAALAFLDVAGYSRLMASDEAATLRRWLSLRGRLVEPRVAGWRGRVVDRTGDGLFVEFRSVLDAVRWAFDVQAALAAAPAAVAEAPPLLVRVAVHLGDVVAAADGGVYGDAVNVAARLQEHAAPGGVVVSRAVHEQVRHLLAYEAEDLGPLALKNMERPVHGFRVGPACAAGVRATAPVRSAPPVATPPAALVAVGAPGAWASVSGFASALASVGRAVWRASRAAPERGHSGP